MHLEHLLNTAAGRHLVLAYAGVVLLQGGYAGWIAWSWWKLRGVRDV